MKYSLNRVNKSNEDNKILSISYYIYCLGRARFMLKYKLFGDIETLYIDSINIKKPHSISRDNHVNIITQKVFESIKNNKTDKAKLKNIWYAKAYFIDIIKKPIFTND